MAARLKPHHQDDIRAKIGVITIIHRLQGHVNGTVELSNTQIQAAKILLDKTMSNAPQIVDTAITGAIDITVRPKMSPEEWAQSHGLGTTVRPTE